VLVNRAQHLFRRDQRGAGVGLNLDHALLRVQAVPHDLALDGVVVAGEGLPLEDDLVALGVGLVEARHHQVQVDGERVHDDDLVGGRANEVGRLVGAVLGHVLPLGEGRVGHVGEMAVDANGRPRLQLGVEVPPDGLGLGAEGVADKVEALLVCGVAIDAVDGVGGGELGYFHVSL